MTQNVHFNDRATSNKKIPPVRIRSKRYKHRYDEFVHEPYNLASGETSMWIAVITQAMMDALTNSTTAESRYHKIEATRWLTENSKDFTTVCLFAGFEPGYIRRMAKRILAAPKPWRAVPGKGKRYHEKKAWRRGLKSRVVLSIPAMETESSWVIA